MVEVGGGRDENSWNITQIVELEDYSREEEWDTQKRRIFKLLLIHDFVKGLEDRARKKVGFNGEERGHPLMQRKKTNDGGNDLIHVVFM